MLPEKVPRKKFDIVAMFFSLETAFGTPETAQRVMGTAASLLKKDGHLLLITNDGDVIQNHVVNKGRTCTTPLFRFSFDGVPQCRSVPAQRRGGGGMPCSAKHAGRYAGAHATRVNRNGAQGVDGRDNARSGGAPGPHTRGSVTRRVVEARRAEARGQRKPSDGTRRNQHSPRHTNDWALRTRKRHQQEHRPQRPTERSDPTQHAKGRTGDCPGPRKGTTTGRTVTRGGGGVPVLRAHGRGGSGVRCGGDGGRA